METNQSEWTPPPPPEDSMFNSGTLEYYAEKIRKDSVKAIVFALLCFVCCGPIFAYFAFTTADEVITNIDIYQVETGRRSMAVAAKVLAVIGAILWVIGLIFRVFINTTSNV